MFRKNLSFFKQKLANAGLLTGCLSATALIHYVAHQSALENFKKKYPGQELDIQMKFVPVIGWQWQYLPVDDELENQDAPAAYKK